MDDSLTYVKGNNLQEVLKSIDDNFAKTVNQNLYKGDKGDNVKTEEKSLKTDGKLTDTGKEVYETIFGDGAAITDERLKDFPETWSLYPAMPLFFAHHEGERGTFIDYSCMVVATEVENVYTYEKHEVFPTIYYNSATGNYCWKLNGVETSIPTYKTPSEGNNVQLFLIKDVVDDNNNTKLEYWDPVNGAWTASAPKDLVAGDLAYKLGSTTAEVGDSTETIATVELYTYNGSEWIAVYYDEKAAVLIEYDNARMSYIWKTIYDNLGQNYTTDLVAANSFKFPDGDTAGHYISAVNNESRSDLMVQYKNGTKSHAIVLDGYEVYTEMPTIKDNVVTHNETSKLIKHEELYTAFKYNDLKDTSGEIDMTKFVGHTFVMIDRGDLSSSDYVRYIYLNCLPHDGDTTSQGEPIANWSAVGVNKNQTEVFEVHYDIDSNTILWMRDTWGNECDYDFIETPTFCVEKNDDRSKGWYKNNKVTRVPDGSTFMFNLYDMEITDDNETSVNSNNIRVENNEIYGSYGWINIKKNTTKKSIHYAGVGGDVVVNNNSIINSNIYMLIGGPGYYVDDIQDSEIAADGYVVIWDSIMSRNNIKNSTVCLCVNWSIIDCDILNSTINNIKLLWIYSESPTSVHAFDLLSYNSSNSFEIVKTIIENDFDQNSSYGINMLSLISCSFHDVVFANEIGFMFQYQNGSDTDPIVSPLIAGRILVNCALIRIKMSNFVLTKTNEKTQFRYYGASPFSILLKNRYIDILGFIPTKYNNLSSADEIDDSVITPIILSETYDDIQDFKYSVIVDENISTDVSILPVQVKTKRGYLSRAVIAVQSHKRCLYEHNLYKLVTTTVPTLQTNVSTLQTNVSTLQNYHES